MENNPGDPPDSEFEYRGRRVVIYAIHIENTPGKFTFHAVIDGRVQTPREKLSGVSHSDAVGAGQNYARKVIDDEADGA